MYVVLLAVVLAAFSLSGCETAKSVVKAVCSSWYAQQKADEQGVDLCPDDITDEQPEAPVEAEKK